MKADLHCHSTASDGSLAPGALVERAAKEGFTLMALTDHDSVDGVIEAQAAAQDCGMELLAGIEFSCGAEKEIHILGYGIDPQDAGISSYSRARHGERLDRAREMVAKLAQNGKYISLDRILETAQGMVGRPHIARALVEAGYASSVKDAFERFLQPGRCGYVPRERVQVGKAVAMIRDAGGAAVLAHPMELKMGEQAMISLVEAWKEQGLEGIEVYHPSAQNNHAAFLMNLARREGMLVTGGSDFHGEGSHGSVLGLGLERWVSMEEDTARLLDTIRQRRKYTR